MKTKKQTKVHSIESDQNEKQNSINEENEIIDWYGLGWDDQYIESYDPNHLPNMSDIEKTMYTIGYTDRMDYEEKDLQEDWKVTDFDDNLNTITWGDEDREAKYIAFINENQ